MVAFGAPMMMALFLLYLGIAALIPFVFGLFGVSRLAPLLMTAALVCGFVFLEVATFFDSLKYQPLYRLLFVDIGMTALETIVLLALFTFAHWLGVRCRSLFIWLKRLLMAA